MVVGQNLLLSILMGWTSIYQLFWGSLGARVLTNSHMKEFKGGNRTPTNSSGDDKVPLSRRRNGAVLRTQSLSASWLPADSWVVLLSHEWKLIKWFLWISFITWHCDMIIIRSKVGLKKGMETTNRWTKCCGQNSFPDGKGVTYNCRIWGFRSPT